GHHRRKSPTSLPVSGWMTTNTWRSSTGPRHHAIEATRIKMGTKARNSEPGLIHLRYPIGSVLQTLPNRKAAAGINTNNSKKESTRGSSNEGNQKAARNPRITEGKDALMSLIGVTR